MAELNLFAGGTPLFQAVHCGCCEAGGGTLTNQWTAPFGYKNNKGTPPLDAHYDEAYGSGAGDFAMGMPLNPSLMEWQYENLKCFDPAVGDFIRLINNPCNHWVSVLRFDVNGADPLMAGAAVTFGMQQVDPVFGDADDPHRVTSYNWAAPSPDPVATAAAAQDVSDPIPLDLPSSTILFLEHVNEEGYLVPLYYPPVFTESTAGTRTIRVRHQGGGFSLGLTISSLPTDTSVKLCDMINDHYFMLKAHTFWCPGQM